MLAEQLIAPVWMPIDGADEGLGEADGIEQYAIRILEDRELEMLQPRGHVFGEAGS